MIVRERSAHLGTRLITISCGLLIYFTTTYWTVNYLSLAGFLAVNQRFLQGRFLSGPPAIIGVWITAAGAHQPNQARLAIAVGLRYNTGTMIGFIRGTVVAKNDRAIIIDTGGVGYSVFVPQPVLHTATAGTPVAVYTYTHIREDILELYGLSTLTDIDLFRQLISVSGVGPRSALAIFDIADSAAISQAIANGDLRFLTTVSGIGKKTAELIIVKLQDKQTISAQAGTSGGEALEALVSLGYSVADARDALLRLPPTLTATAERVTAALKLLSKH